MNQQDITSQEFFKKFNEPKHSYIQTQKFTSDYYKDLTQQKNVIERAFQSNNYTYIRKLPKQLKGGVIFDERVKRVKKQLGEEDIERKKTYQEKYEEHEEAKINKKMQQIGSMGYFEAFTYIGEQYDYAKYLAMDEKSRGELKRREISDLDFRPSDIQAKGKYQDPFEFRDKAYPKIKDTPNYLFPFNIPSDTYSNYHQSIKRKKINDQAQILAGPFLPSMKQKTLGRVHRSQLNQILQTLQTFLNKYLKKYPYILAVTVKDHIQLLFQQSYLQDIKLKTVMSLICQNQLLTKYLLKREIHRWGVHDATYICFSIIPPWVAYSGQIQPSTGSAAQITKILKELDNKSILQHQ